MSHILFTRGELDILADAIRSMRGKQLLVVCDFDHTVSAYWSEPHGDVMSVSSHCVIEKSGLFGDEFEQASEERFQKYYPLETNIHISHEEREQACNEWWKACHDAIVDAGFHRDHIGQAVAATRSKMRLRHGVESVIDKINKTENAQMMIFSAGLADIIEEVMKTSGLHDVPVFGNRMHFNENGYLEKFDEWIIHSCNKGESVMRTISAMRPDIWMDGKNMSGEKPFNCIVVGDSLGDATMADHLDHVVDKKMKIGFVNIKQEERLPKYRVAFDVLITNDGSMSTLSAIIDAINDEAHVPELIKLFKTHPW